MYLSFFLLLVCLITDELHHYLSPFLPNVLHQLSIKVAYMYSKYFKVPRSTPQLQLNLDRPLLLRVFIHRVDISV